MYLFQKIEELTSMYHDARKNIGEFILNQDIDLTNYSMKEIAQMTYTSKTTLVRFAKTLGFSGWNDFMKAYVKESLYQEKYKFSIDVNQPFQKNDTIDEMLQNIAQLEIETIEKTKDLVDPQVLKQAVDYLLNASRIVVFCANNNIHLASLFKNKMLAIEKNVVVAQDGDATFWSTLLNEFDCAIIISYSGNNEYRDPECYIQRLKERNVKVIGITSEGDNYIHNHVDCLFTMASQEKLYSKIASFSTEQSVMYILNIIFSYYFMNDYDNNYLKRIHKSRTYENDRKSILHEVNED